MKKTCTQTLYRQELKGKILQTAMEEFTQKGVRAVKMDDIATRLSISKRTLYEIYSNKEDFVHIEYLEVFLLQVHRLIWSTSL